MQLVKNQNWRRYSHALLLCFIVFVLTFPLMAQDITPAAPTTPPNDDTVALTLIAEGLYRPLYVTNAGDDSGRLFIFDQHGRIWIWQDGALSADLFLDLSGIVSVEFDYSERGLLGLAFHPNYVENGLFYVNYTAAQANHATKVVAYQVSADNPNKADPESAHELLTIAQPFPNHNGGHLVFGPDGYLYIGVGDGGHRDDLLQAGQDRGNLLGTLLRIDVDNTADGAYGIPADNPVFTDDTFAPEVWAWGLRNPWRFSFDRMTGDLYIGDVGQDQWEEINRQPADSPGGVNYGWKAYEGMHRYLGADADGDVVMPILEYQHNRGCSVTGGYVYRGEAIPALQGYYLFSDYCNGTIWAAYADADGVWQFDVLWELGQLVSSFGEDENGELYVTVYDAGQVYRFDPVDE